MSPNVALAQFAERHRKLSDAIRKGTVRDVSKVVAQYAGVLKDSSGVPTSLAISNPNSAQVSQIDDKLKAIPFIVTVLQEDRDGDVVIPRGIETGNYKNNPVVFLGHQEWIVPIGVAKNPVTKRLAWDVSDTDVRSVCYFDAPDPDAMFIYGKVQRGILSATSIAFVPIEAYKRDEYDKAYRGEKESMAPVGWLFKRVDLTEWSIVGVPSNAGAIRDALDSEKSFISPQLQKALVPYAAQARGRCFSGWCPVPAKAIARTSKGATSVTTKAARKSPTVTKDICPNNGRMTLSDDYGCPAAFDSVRKGKAACEGCGKSLDLVPFRLKGKSKMLLQTTAVSKSVARRRKAIEKPSGNVDWRGTIDGQPAGIFTAGDSVGAYIGPNRFSGKVLWEQLKINWDYPLPPQENRAYLESLLFLNAKAKEKSTAPCSCSGSCGGKGSCGTKTVRKGAAEDAIRFMNSQPHPPSNASQVQNWAGNQWFNQQSAQREFKNRRAFEAAVVEAWKIANPGKSLNSTSGTSGGCLVPDQFTEDEDMKTKKKKKPATKTAARRKMNTTTATEAGICNISGRPYRQGETIVVVDPGAVHPYARLDEAMKLSNTQSDARNPGADNARQGESPFPGAPLRRSAGRVRRKDNAEETAQEEATEHGADMDVVETAMEESPEAFGGEETPEEEATEEAAIEAVKAPHSAYALAMSHQHLKALKDYIAAEDEVFEPDSGVRKYLKEKLEPDLDHHMEKMGEMFGARYPNQEMSKLCGGPSEDKAEIEEEDVVTKGRRRKSVRKNMILSIYVPPEKVNSIRSRIEGSGGKVRINGNEGGLTKLTMEGDDRQIGWAVSEDEGPRRNRPFKPFEDSKDGETDYLEEKDELNAMDGAVEMEEDEEVEKGEFEEEEIIASDDLNGTEDADHMTEEEADEIVDESTEEILERYAAETTYKGKGQRKMASRRKGNKFNVGDRVTFKNDPEAVGTITSVEYDPKSHDEPVYTVKLGSGSELAEESELKPSRKSAYRLSLKNLSGRWFVKQVTKDGEELHGPYDTVDEATEVKAEMETEEEKGKLDAGDPRAWAVEWRVRGGKNGRAGFSTEQERDVFVDKLVQREGDDIDVRYSDPTQKSLSRRRKGILTARKKGIVRKNFVISRENSSGRLRYWSASSTAERSGGNWVDDKASATSYPTQQAAQQVASQISAVARVVPKSVYKHVETIYVPSAMVQDYKQRIEGKGGKATVAGSGGNNTVKLAIEGSDDQIGWAIAHDRGAQGDRQVRMDTGEEIEIEEKDSDEIVEEVEMEDDDPVEKGIEWRGSDGTQIGRESDGKYYALNPNGSKQGGPFNSLEEAQQYRMYGTTMNVHRSKDALEDDDEEVVEMTEKGKRRQAKSAASASFDDWISRMETLAFRATGVRLN